MVDQDATLRQRYARELTRAGFHVDVDTDDADEAGLRAHAPTRYDIESYDLLVTHNESPKVSGASPLNRRDLTPATLLFVPESGSMPDDQVRLELAAILTKPVASELLVQQVKAVRHRVSSGLEYCWERKSSGTERFSNPPKGPSHMLDGSVAPITGHQRFTWH